MVSARAPIGAIAATMAARIEIKNTKHKRKMPKQYIPPADGAYNDWQVNFAALLTADPTSYGETAAVAANIQALTDTWVGAYNLSTDPSTRTTPTIQDKDNARVSCEASTRIVAIRIRNNTSVTDQQRQDLGLTVVKTTPTPVSAPTSAPVLGLRSANIGVHTLQYTDDAAPDGKAKPEGSIGVELWQAVGEVSAVDPSQAVFGGIKTKSPMRISQKPEDVGKVATYFARFSTRGSAQGEALTGPWSAPLVVTII